ncbi:Cathepsin B-like cysteine proteinase [Giardia duodenalis]|uniref:Cathepsin B n=2 Tax=Giardia intestinalis TaxID=5741 RepID=C6LMY0_GIAIB|nr:Cathepsin B precursor [Giardia intestinalis ATCC 50581]ESU43261.1 Cathepsin B-like cysteine proteinase [Giardia intestinalis]
MKLFLLAAAAFSAPALTVSELNHIKSLNPRWKAGIPKRFEGLTKDEISSLLMPISFLNRDRAAVPRGTIADTKVPDSFDFREEYPHCIPEVVDQGSCGSCWAFSSVASLGDRRCFAGLDKKAVTYSPQYVVSCDHGDMACDGGWLQSVWRFLTKTGTTTNECVPYQSGTTGARGTCPTKCADGGELSTVKAKKAVDYGLDCDLIMKALVTGGPLQTAFTVYSDFMYYEGGVYQHMSGRVEGGHAVEMVGYGTDEYDVDYWIIRNSWGPDWGEDGYFRIIRMTNECGIEEQVMGGIFEE